MLRQSLLENLLKNLNMKRSCKDPPSKNGPRAKYLLQGLPQGLG